MSQNDKPKKTKIEPYYPVYARTPNKLSHYEERDFTDKAGNKAILNIAHYKDKHGVSHEAIAQVKWLKN